MLTATAAAVAASSITITQAPAQPASNLPYPNPQFIYCLNTSTIRGQKLGIVKEAQIASKAGYTAIEPWMRSIHEYQKAGGSLKDLKNRLNDLGLTIESAIDFPKWIVDDDTERAKGLEAAKRSMDTLAQLGAKRIAAPPSGATKEAGLDLLKAAQRYRALLELGDTMGVTPQVEVWGFSKNLHLLGQAMFVAIESGHPKACLLPDIYHVYKGGSSFHSAERAISRAPGANVGSMLWPRMAMNWNPDSLRPIKLMPTRSIATANPIHMRPARPGSPVRVAGAAWLAILTIQSSPLTLAHEPSHRGRLRQPRSE